MNKPILAGAQFPLPPQDDGDRICVELSIPSDTTSLGNFVGALMMLARWNNYLPDPDGIRLNKPTADIWRDIVMSLAFTDCIGNAATHLIGEMDLDMTICEQLRWQDGVLQGLCCGEWTDIEGNPGAVGGSDQGDDGGTPGAGHCTSYHGNFTGSNQYLIPAIVSTGDTLTFTNVSGAGQDGFSAITAWRCTDGTVFFAGSCGAAPGYHDGGDPSASAFHMQLIVQIAGVYYPIVDGTPIVVGAAVTNAPILVQVNDSDITDNLGSYSFDVEVCNNATPSFSHTFDFITSDGGWTPDVTTPPWTPGVGWALHSNAGASQNDPYIQFTARTLTKVTFFYTGKSGAINNDDIRGGIGGGLHLKDNALSDPSPTSWIGSQSCNEINFLFTYASGDAYVTLTKCIIEGVGTDPF